MGGMTCIVALRGTAHVPPLDPTRRELHLKLGVQRRLLFEMRTQLSQQRGPGLGRHDGAQVAEGRAPRRLAPLQARAEPIAEPRGAVREIQFPKSIAAGPHGARARHR